MIAQLYGILLPAAIWCDNCNDTHYKQVQLGGLCSALMTRINSDLQRKCLKDYSCWADGNQALIKKARNEMFLKIDQNPSGSINLRGSEKFNHSNQDLTLCHRILQDKTQ